MWFTGRAMPRIAAKDLAAHRARAEGRLLDAVGEVLAERGPAGVTVADVAARAGMARSSAYGYAPDRDALLHAYARRAAEQLAADATGALDGAADPAARLAVVVRRLGAGLGAVLDLDPADGALRPVHELVASVLDDGIAAGALRPVDVPATVALVVAALGAERAAVRAGAVTPEAATERAAAFVLHALRP